MSSTLQATKEKTPFLAVFNEHEKELNQFGLPFLQRLRNTAVARFAELGLPTPRHEDWRFTNVAPLTRHSYRLTPPVEKPGLTWKKLAGLTFGADTGNRLVFLNGHYRAELSDVRDLPAGTWVGSLATLLREKPALAEPYLGRTARFEDNAFTALNTAFLQDGAAVLIPANTVVAPLHLVFVSTSGTELTMSFPRNLVVVGAGSQVTLLESYVGLQDDVYFTNAVTEILVGEQANVDHYKVQQESDEAFHIANTCLQQSKASRFSSHYLGFGGALVRNEVRAVLDAEGCECTVNGLYMASDRQHMDNHTVIDHAKAHCNSHELYKGILDGKAHGVFNGKIFVRQDAQKTDAKQTNQTLLLSDDAVINTKPQLEIYADDVKCTHGATVGQLDDESIFYLRSRGIGATEARALLTFAFANDVVSRIQIAALRTQLEAFLLESQDLAGEAAAKEQL